MSVEAWLLQSLVAIAAAEIALSARLAIGTVAQPLTESEAILLAGIRRNTDSILARLGVPASVWISPAPTRTTTGGLLDIANGPMH